MMLGIELVNTAHVFDTSKGAEPFVHQQQFAQSMGPKAKIRLLLEGWKGVTFTPEQAKAFNYAKLIGAACEVNLIKKTSKAGKDRIEIGSILMLAEGTQVPAPKNEQLIFTIPSHASEFNTEKFNKLGKWWQDKIRSSDEFKALGMQAGTGTPAAQPASQGTVSSNNLPF